MSMIPTRERWRSRLPHWEVEGHWHFVTIRCHGSLPAVAKLKLREIHTSLAEIDPQSEAFQQLQRRYFLTTEKYLDAVIAMGDEGWLVGEATVMPNHIHLLILRQNSDFSLKEILERFKGRSARWINQALGRSGRFWQEDWFDRWMRHEGELTKTIDYIRNNPVKAKLVSEWKDYRWRISNQAEL